MQYAEIQQDTIINLAVCEDAELAAKLGLVVVPDQVGIGWRLDNGNWLEPIPIAPTEKWISQKAFRRLWSLTERGLLDNPMQALPESLAMPARLLIASVMEDVKASADQINALDLELVQAVALMVQHQVLSADRAMHIISTLRECSLDDANTVLETAKAELAQLFNTD